MHSWALHELHPKLGQLGLFPLLHSLSKHFQYTSLQHLPSHCSLTCYSPDKSLITLTLCRLKNNPRNVQFINVHDCIPSPCHLPHPHPSCSCWLLLHCSYPQPDWDSTIPFIIFNIPSSTKQESMFDRHLRWMLACDSMLARVIPLSILDGC